MKRNLRLALGFILMFAGGLGKAQAQEIKTDFRKLSAYYSQAGYLTINIGVKIFAANSDGPISSESYQIRKKDTKFFYAYNNLKTIITPSMLLLIHQKDRNIVYTKVQQSDYNEYLKKYFIYSLDSVIASYDSVRFSHTPEHKQYSIYTSKKGIYKTDLFLNPKDGTLDRIVYYYNPKLNKQPYRVELQFETNTQPFSEDVFSEKKYILSENGKIKLQPAFSNYHLIDTRYEN